MFGGSFPNPNPLAASLAKQTAQIRLRAGSVNAPQHATPLRVAEDWAVVDNLSGGRVDISFGAGWNVNDFALQIEAECHFIISCMMGRFENQRAFTLEEDFLFVNQAGMGSI